MSNSSTTPDDLSELSRGRDVILEQLDKIIVGQKTVLNEMLIALFARGHCLIIGVPGLAKTLMVRSLAGTLQLDFKRIQFTPDLMPSDIIGTDILEENRETGSRQFRFHKGPLFTSMLLADEINRTPPKTQAALLEAMQEHRVTASGQTYTLPEPFMVLATQNPIEQEGTYPLPEAQLDRFMFCVQINYPDCPGGPQCGSNPAFSKTRSGCAGESPRGLVCHPTHSSDTAGDYRGSGVYWTLGPLGGWSACGSVFAVGRQSPRFTGRPPQRVLR